MLGVVLAVTGFVAGKEAGKRVGCLGEVDDGYDGKPKFASLSSKQLSISEQAAYIREYRIGEATKREQIEKAQSFSKR